MDRHRSLVSGIRRIDQTVARASAINRRPQRARVGIIRDKYGAVGSIGSDGRSWATANLRRPGLCARDTKGGGIHLTCGERTVSAAWLVEKCKKNTAPGSTSHCGSSGRAMVALPIVHTVLNGLLATHLAWSSLINPLGRLACRVRSKPPGDAFPFSVLFSIAALTSLLFAAMGMTVGPSGMTIASSAWLLHWAFVSYYLLQRFRDKLELSELVRICPALFPACLLVAVASCVLAILLYTRWYFLPTILILPGAVFVLHFSTSHAADTVLSPHVK